MSIGASCQRCDRLNLQCAGAGQRRFIFVEAKQIRGVSVVKALGNPSRELSNSETSLRTALAHSLDPTIPIEMNLLYNFGGFLAEIPCRIGVNTALDRASETLVATLSRYRKGGPKPSPEVLRLHGSSLAALRSCLGDDKTANSGETLCAVQIIMIYQVSRCSFQRFRGLNGMRI